jgi:Fe-coproporphyrin III synthase
MSIWLPTIVNFLKSRITKKPVAAGIELTNKCNLHCPMCYWWLTKPNDELDNPEMINLMISLRKQGIIHVTLVGGEPTLRPELVKKAAAIFPYTWVVTNGSFSEKNAPPIKNTLYILSLDGTKKIHDQIRMPGLYRKIKQNFSNRADCFTSTTITRMNMGVIEDMIADWSDTKIVGMAFNFATPIKGNRNIFTSWPEREEVIDKLIKLKTKYGDFILVSRRMLELFRHKEVVKWYLNCPLKWMSVSYTADGVVKTPCILGHNAICNMCGCHVAPILQASSEGDIETILILTKILAATRK